MNNSLLAARHASLLSSLKARKLYFWLDQFLGRAQGKEKVSVRFEAKEGNSIASVFGIRMIRGETDHLH